MDCAMSLTEILQLSSVLFVPGLLWLVRIERKLTRLETYMKILVRRARLDNGADTSTEI